jgi:hypothetical protein
MSIAHIQDTSVGSNAAVTSVSTGAFASNPGTGGMDYVVAFVWGVGTSVVLADLNITDTYSNGPGGSYTLIGFKANTTVFGCMAYAPVTTTGASFAVTAHNSVSGKLSIVASEFTGIAATSPVDGSAVSASGTSQTAAPGNLTVTAGDLVLAVVCDLDVQFSPVLNTPAGWNSAGKATSSLTAVGQGIWAVNPSSPTNPSWTVGTGSNAAWVASQFAMLAGVVLAPVPPAIVVARAETHWSQWQE